MNLFVASGMRKALFLTIIAGLTQCATLAQTVALSVSPTTTGAFNVSMALSGGAQPAAIQWTINYSTSDISALSFLAGAAATAASKSVSCSNGQGSVTCVLYGMNESIISAGVLAQATVTFSSGSVASSTALQFSSVTASDANGAAVGATATNGTIAVPIAVPTVTGAGLSGLSCSPATLTGAGVLTCTITLSKAAPTGGFGVTLSSTNTNLSFPTLVTVPAGSAAATFSVTAKAVTSDQVAVITATANGISKSFSISLLSGPPQPASLSCNPATVISGNTTTCTVTLSKAAPSTGVSVSLSGGTTALSIPATVTVASGALTGTFLASAAGTASQSVPLTASVNGGSVSFSVLVQPVLKFSLLGNRQEIQGTTNGSAITPAYAPAGLIGKVIVNGTGSVNFAPDAAGNGVYFLNCCANTGNAYYKFTGTSVGSIFDLTQGQISFSLTSRQSFAQRSLDLSYRSMVDVRDGNTSNHLINIITRVASGRLLMSYQLGSTLQHYFFPAGQEDALFGNGVTLKVSMTWSNGTLKLYLNGTLMQSVAYTAPVPNWTSASTFDIGAYEYLTYGGYNSCDDTIAEFAVGPPR